MKDDSDIRNSVSSTNQSKTISISSKQISYILIIAAVAIIGFLGGIAYQKSHTNSANTPVAGLAHGGFSRYGGGIGTVSSVSATSISVLDRTGATKTYAITSTTTISNNGQTVAASSIQTGDRVLIIPSSTGGSTASRIMVNPSFGGGFGGQAGPGSSTGSSTGSTTN
jgi:hypothetical protein